MGGRATGPAMEPTRRAVSVAGLAALLATLAAVLSRPWLLAGTAAVAGWLVARQYRFLRALSRLDRELSVEQAPSRRSVVAGDETAVRVAASLDGPAPASVSVAAAPPVSASVPATAERRVAIAPGERAAGTEVTVGWPVAGAATFGRPTVTAADPAGLFRARFRRGPTPTVTVEPRAPRDLHVGRGGDPDAPFGDHSTGRTGPGIDAAGVREYAPGDPAARIDWAATARLGEPHVREFETATAVGTWLVVDARPPMATGPPGRTAADYARQVALAEVAAARAAGDPVGLTVVGPDGPTVERPPATGDDHYRSLRTLLYDVGVPPDGGAHAAGGVAGRSAVRLPAGTPMAEALAPFATPATGPDGDLVAAATRAAGSGAPRTAVVTADADGAEVRAVARRARAEGGRVALYVAPAALFAPGGLADVDAVAERYRAFESLRRDLDGVDDVAAYEVAPAGRLAAVAGAGAPVTLNPRRGE